MAEISGGRSRISVTTRFLYARRNNGVDMEIAGRSRLFELLPLGESLSHCHTLEGGALVGCGNIGDFHRTFVLSNSVCTYAGGV
jgi:hypothetical protein